MEKSRSLVFVKKDQAEIVKSVILDALVNGILKGEEEKMCEIVVLMNRCIEDIERQEEEEEKENANGVV